jgi:carboxymethylenebutenolidase
MSLNHTIPTLEGDASFGAYLARPEGTPRGAIIVIQEIFGVNPGIRQKCDKLAAEGWLAIAPDLFWRLKPGMEFDPDKPEEFNQALEWMGKFDQDQGIRDIEATIRHIRGTLGVPKVACIGYCLGGRLAFMTAARTDIDASVGYYGVGLEGLLGEKHAIAKPLLLHIATKDAFVPPEAQAAIHAGLDDHPKVTIYDYEGVDHGFATELGKRRNEEAATLADRRTAEFLAKALA